MHKIQADANSSFKTTMHALFSIPELLWIIFENLKPIDQRQCVSVCTLWSEVVLDLLWADVQDIKRLLNVLAPVQKKYSLEDDPRLRHQNATYIFDSPPDHTRWIRFQSKYCSRIRSIRHWDSQQISSLMDTLTSLHASSSTSPILPRLQTLYWCGPLETLGRATTFMHPDIRNFKTSVGWSLDPNLTELQSYVVTIPNRMPALTSLVLDGFAWPEYTEPIVQILQAFPCITRLDLPAFQDISPFLTCIAPSRRMQNLSFFSYLFFGHRVRGVVERISPASDNDDFDCLNSLRLVVSNYSGTVSFIQSHSLHSLNTLSLETRFAEYSVSVRVLLKALASSCPNLAKTTLISCYAMNVDALQDAYVDDRVVGFDDMRSILTCRKMSHFHFRHPLPVCLSDKDMEEIAMAWPDLEELELCPHPLVEIYPEDAPTVLSVFHLTHHCLKLHNLSLYLDTRLSRTPPLPTSPVTKHADLKLLNVGVSEMEPEDAPGIAKLLGQLCSADCLLVFPPLDETYDWELDEPIESVWDVVAKTFPQFSKVYKAHGGANLQDEDLQHEVEVITRAMDLEKFQSTGIVDVD
ncbi:hypothetical protein D9758_008702 [Tetrapyrgos nigripes]|uniref:F-box domain-containing protein n=1 Tax=Tetrapyrgos nigripes TaxID=182062 RepID=A0A8H5D5I6_9AGAR|nr:hypothetical protein D9758_008702 [Tetrapyrgos nigripes]